MEYIHEEFLQSLINKLKQIITLPHKEENGEILKELQKYCEELIVQFAPMSKEEKNNTNILFLKQKEYLLKKDNQKDSPNFRSAHFKIQRYEDTEALETIFHIDEKTISPIMTLTTLVNFFSVLAHQKYSQRDVNLAAFFYSIKTDLLKYICQNYDKKDIAIIPAKNNNIDSAIYIRIPPGNFNASPFIFCWHASIKDLNIDFSPDETQFFQELQAEVAKFTNVDRSDNSKLRTFIEQRTNQDTKNSYVITDSMFSLKNIKDVSFDDNTVTPLLNMIHGNNTIYNFHNINRLWDFNNRYAKTFGSYEIRKKDSLIEQSSNEQVIYSSEPNITNVIQENQNNEDILHQFTNSEKPEIQLLLNLLQSDKSFYGFQLQDIAKMELIQIAYLQEQINFKELEEQQKKLFNSMIENAQDSERIEIKTYSKKNGEKRTFLVISPSAQLTAGQLRWQLTGSNIELFQSEQYAGKVQVTEGQRLRETQNIDVIQALSTQATRKKRFSKATKETVTTAIEFDGGGSYEETITEQTPVPDDIVDEQVIPSPNDIEQFHEPDKGFASSLDIVENLLEQPDFVNRFQSIYENMSPEKKVLFMKTLQLYMPELFNENPDRNGGPEL